MYVKRVNGNMRKLVYFNIYLSNTRQVGKTILNISKFTDFLITKSSNFLKQALISKK